MNTFVPLNVEIEEESEDEVDDSKEIQIEEALKLYQNALKLHSQGPNFYREAEEAYNELFRSEIFTYPESFSESRRLESYGDDEELDEDDDDYLIPSHTVFASSTDGGPSSLPQILYLAYKNHGLFLLDSLKSQLIRLEHDIRADGKLVSSQYASNVAYSSLVLLIEALDRDDSDLELWRRVSRIAGFLGSRRIARFCLEAVLDTDDGDLASWTEPVGLEESFAFEQLKPLLRSLDDKLSRSQISAKFDESKDIITLLKKSIDPCPYLPALSAGFSSDCSKIYSKNQTINVPMRTWASCGNAILYQLSQETKGLVCPEPGASYSLVLPLRRSAEILPPPPKRITNSEVIADIDRSSPIQNGHEHRPRNAGVRNVILTAFPQTGPEESPVPVDESFLNQLIKSPNRINHTEPSVAEKGLKKANSDEQQTIAQRVNTDVGPVALPTRKRSSEMAELPETTDIGRSRSKRIRARGSIDPDSVKNNTAEDWSQWYEQQLQIYLEADGPAFGTIERVLAKLGLKSSGSLKRVRDIVSNRHMSNQASSPDAPREAGQIAPQDLSITLDGWDLPRSRAFLNGHDPKDPAGGASGTSNSGFTSFLEHSSQQSQTPPERDILSGDVGLDGFAERTDKQEWLNVHQLAFQWLVELLGQETFPNSVAKSRSLYVDYIWPDKLKAAVVQMLVIEDEAIYSETKRIVEDLGKQKYSEELHDANPLVLKSVVWFKRTCTEFVQTIFELHLDVYGRITNPSSEVDASTRLLQRDRLCRWAAFSSKVMNGWSWPGHSLDDWGPSSDHLRVRFMWASVVCTSLLEPASRDHTILCFQDMIRILEELGAGQATRQIVIELPNNAIMPELSIEIAEKEISRLTTMDFFMGIFSSENNDPLAIIEALEPLLQLSIARRKSFSSESEEPVTTAMAVDGQPVEDPLADHKSEGDFEDSPSPKLFEASQFLDRGNLPLRLFLWQKLRDAYQAIHYPPQVLSCNLRSFALIVNHLSSSSYVDSSPNTRQENLLRWLHRLDDLMTRVLALALSNNSVFEPFECLDGDHVRTSLESLTKLRDILHVFALWEDTIRVGQTQAPIPANLAANKGLAKSTDKFRDMIVKTWTLQYALLKEAIAQNLQLFDDHNEILLQYLKQAHQALGLRCYCSLANKIFLRLMKKELEGSRLAERWDIDMAQLVFDLYGLKISTTSTEMQDHGCIAEELDRHTALEIVDLVMLQTNRMNIKDLLKSDLKFAVDKMQQVIKISKTVNATARTFNSRLVNNYLKSPINPIDLYRSLRGIGGLPARPVNTEGTEIAAKGWYFLLGHIALTKFRSQKRSSAGSMDDLEIARTFFRHDLEFDIDKWETWYRLAQVYDTMIEEDSTWTADKLDNHMEELAVLQRKAIHCYAMAIAVATRGADASFEGTSKIADLRADFGTRIYASTREPFSMQAFSLEGFKRPYNRAGSGMYEDCPFRSLPLYPAWKLASTLLRQASNQKPQNWLISYTLGKVLWKMHNCSEEVRGLVKRTDHQPVIDTLVRAIESCPEKRDSRHPDKDPILEPHYKLVSVVHKLVHSKRIPAVEGCRILKATPYSRKAPHVQDAEDWEGYMFQVLKALRSADKSNWHHRMVARAAHTIYDDVPHDPRAALGAKHELTQQIFTKTMAIQVWKPDNERAGRHFVYTSRYVRFFCRLLYQLNDKLNLEALARRIRKRVGDFVNHAMVWQEVCRAYLQLLRHQPYCKVPLAYQEQIFTGMNPATFQLNAARLEAWAHSLSSNAPIIDVLREAIEFKKLNNNYFKSSIFEDVIGDIYAHLYETVVPELIAKETAEENRVRMRVDNILTTSSTNATETPPPGPAGEQVGERRTKANRVTSREIIRKAEAIAAKPVLTVPAKILKPLAPAPASEQGKVPGTPALAVVVHDDATRDPGSSVPGSVHDSADDESELSEADEEVLEVKATSAGETRAPLFPNLVSTNTGATKTDGMDTSGGGFVTANEGLDEEEEEEMEEEEEDLQEEDMQAKRGAKEAEIQGEAMEL